jgi:serine/threonine-protein kinase ATR
VLDYLSRWVQEKQTKKGSRGYDPLEIADQIQRVDIVLSMIPPEIISQRAVECKSYSRALFYWEQHIRDCRERKVTEDKNTELLERLQDIYTQIDEPDGIEGISAHLHVLDIEQQILGHRKAGRWTAAQSWYEIKLAETPDDVDVQVNLLTCLKESGQHGMLSGILESLTWLTPPQMFCLITSKACKPPQQPHRVYFHSQQKLPGQQEDGSH